MSRCICPSARQISNNKAIQSRPLLKHSILMHRRTVQRKGNIWNSSMYVHCPANQQPQQQQSRSRRHLDHDDTEGPSGESARPFGNISGVAVWQTGYQQQADTSLLPMRMTKAKTIRHAKTNVHRCQPTDNDGGTPPRPWTTSAESQPFPQHMMMRKMNHRPPHPGQKGCGVLWRGKSRPQNCPWVKPSARPSLPMRWTTTRRRGWQTTRDKLLEEQPQTKCKNKQPLSGAPNFKNRPLLPISVDDLDDDQLGITQCTQPTHHNSGNRPADMVLHISQSSEDGAQ